MTILGFTPHVVLRDDVATDREDAERFRALATAFLERDQHFEGFMRRYGGQPAGLDEFRSVVDSATIYAGGCKSKNLIA